MQSLGTNAESVLLWLFEYSLAYMFHGTLSNPSARGKGQNHKRNEWKRKSVKKNLPLKRCLRFTKFNCYTCKHILEIY